MNKLLFLTLAILSLALTTESVNAQQPLPADANAFYTKAMTRINKKHVAWIRTTALEAKNKKLDVDAIRALVSKYALQEALKNGDIDALIQLVMMECAKQEEQELRDQMAQMENTLKAKKAMRDALTELKSNRSGISKVRLDSFRQMTKVTWKPMTRRDSIHLVQVKNENTSIKRVNATTTDLASQADLKSVQDELKGKLDGMNEISDMTSLRLQMMMDRRSKFISTLSNIMKKIDSTEDTLIQNLK
jgi:hypothetical protein